MMVGGAMIAALLAVSPETSLARTEITVACAVTQLVLAVLAARLREHVRALVAVAVVAVLLVTLLVGEADTLARLALASSAYTYLVLYAAYAFDRNARHGILVLIAVGAAVGGALSPLGLRPVVWMCTVLGVSLAGAVVGELVARLRLYATIDSLTGVLTRTAFDAVATTAIAGSERRGEALSVAIIDLDKFKDVNDTHGHAAGDVMLGRVVDAWRGGLRSQDLLGRLGGDEFALLLPGTTVEGARALLDDLAEVSPLAFSAGLATAGPGDDIAALRRRADAGMYAVKRTKPDAVG